MRRRGSYIVGGSFLSIRGATTSSSLYARLNSVTITLIHSNRKNALTKTADERGYSSKSTHPLYPEHRPTSPFQKMLLAVGSSVAAIVNPERGDMVATLGETTGMLALPHMLEKMKNHPVGSQILAERPVVTEETIRFDHLRTLPNHTFGGAYAEWMGTRQFTPDERPIVHFVDNEELAYVMQRYRQVHDFLHVLCGLPTTVEAEIGLKWFEMIQTKLPMCALSSFVGPLRLMSNLNAHQLLIRSYIPWAVRSANKAEFILNCYYEKHLEKDLNDVRTMLNIEPYSP